jgi:5,6-dimethylbenzimidazole synthase
VQFTSSDAECLGRLLRWRRDVRHFRSDPIPVQTITLLREAIDFVPSVGNARPWRLIQAESPPLRAAVRENFLAANADALATYEDERREQYLRLKLEGLDRAPLQIAVFTVCDPEAGRRLGRLSMPETLLQSTAMAIHTLWLTARVNNIGMGVVSILDPRAMGHTFEVPEDWRFTAYLCLGYAEFDDDVPLLHRAGWQENEATHWEVR